MARTVLLLAVFACASTTPPPTPDRSDAVAFEVEDALALAASAIQAGDLAEARTLIADGEAQIRSELGTSPDRHQLSARAADLRSQLERPKAIVEATPAPAPTPTPVPAPETNMVAVLEEPMQEDAVAAFRQGPLRDRKEALKMIGTAKRAPSKTKRRRLFGEARALLASCASEGSRLVESAPLLQDESFKVGSRNRSADWIVVQCRSKVRAIDRRLKAKQRQS